jgi:hypothetical protein
MYRRGCHCLRCRVANAKDKADRSARVTPCYVDAAPVTKHLQNLADLGIGWRRMGKLARVDGNHLRSIRSGKRKLIRATLAAKILAVQRPSPALGQRINSAPTWRQIKWLQTEGFTLQEIARRIGKHSLDRRSTITVRYAARIDGLFRAMQE